MIYVRKIVKYIILLYYTDMKNLVETEFDSFYDAATKANSFIKQQIAIPGKEGKFLAVRDFIPLQKLDFTDPVFTKNGIYIYQGKKEDGTYGYYVGKAKNLGRRTIEHLRRYNSLKVPDSPALHAALRKHGLNNFSIAILETDIDDLDAAEQNWIRDLNTYLDKEDYNLTAGGEGGYTQEPKLTEELFREIVERLVNTDEAMSDIAASYKQIEDGKVVWSLGVTTIKNICYGNNDLPAYQQEFKKTLSSEYTWPLRTREERVNAGKKATKEKSLSKFVGFLPEDEDLTTPIKVVYGTNDIARLEEPDIFNALSSDRQEKYGYRKIGKFLNGYNTGKSIVSPKKSYQPAGYKYRWAKFDTLTDEVKSKVELLK